MVDSYRASFGVYGGANRFSNGGVRAGGKIVVNGNANIQGVQLAVSPSGLTPVPTPDSYTDLGDLNITADYTFTAGDYMVGSLNINGSPTIRVQGGRVRVWFRALNLAGNVGFGSANPGDLWFFSRIDALNANINGTCKLTGVVFAPNIPINHSGSSGVYGALVGSTVNLNGNVAVHFDEDLNGGCGGGAGGLSIARAGSKETSPNKWQIPEGRNLAIAPNPARGQASVFYRSGDGKRAKLSLYTLDGQPISTTELQPSGDQVGRAELSFAGLAPGVYFAVLQVDRGEGLVARETFKIALVK